VREISSKKTKEKSIAIDKEERDDYNYLMHAFRKCYSKELGDHETYVKGKRYKNVVPTAGPRTIATDVGDFERKFPKKPKDEYEAVDDNFKDSFEWELHEKEEHDQYLASRGALLSRFGYNEHFEKQSDDVRESHFELKAGGKEGRGSKK
jgi:hypothetical protein